MRWRRRAPRSSSSCRWRRPAHSGDWRGTFLIPNITSRLASGDYVLRLMLYRPQFGLALSVESAAVVHIPHSASLSLGSPYLVQNHGLLPLQARFTSPNMGSVDD